MFARSSSSAFRPLEADLVVVGSGPTHLVRAINAADDGQETLILESQARIGGAWAAVATFDDELHRYEVVPHHLSPYPDAYAMLEAAGLELVPRHIHTWDHGRLSSGSKRWYKQNYPDSFPVGKADGGRLVLEDQWYAHQDWLDVSRRSEIEYYKGFHRDVNANLRYFADGVQALIDRLRDRIRESGCSLMTTTPVASVRLAGDGVELATPHHRVFAKRVLLGQHFSGELAVEGLPDEPRRTNHFYSLLVRVRLDHDQAVRYVNVKDDPGTDFGPMSYLQLTKSQVQVYRDEIYTYCIGGSFDVALDAREVARELLRRMSRVGIVSGDYEIWDARWEHLEVAAQSGEFCAAVNEATDGRVEMSHVAAIGQEMSDHADAWATALGTPGGRGGSE
ncbi:MAG: NAD(P)-binding protein [Actinomycetota bacterium]